MFTLCYSTSTVLVYLYCSILECACILHFCSIARSIGLLWNGSTALIKCSGISWDASGPGRSLAGCVSEKCDLPRRAQWWLMSTSIKQLMILTIYNTEETDSDTLLMALFEFSSLFGAINSRVLFDLCSLLDETIWFWTFFEDDVHQHYTIHSL